LGQIVGIYTGAGVSFTFASYLFKDIDGWYPSSVFAMDVLAGVNLFNMLDISYTFKTNFKRIGNKLSIGYTYRFK